MIRLRVKGGNFDPIIAELDRLARPDLTPLVTRLREIMIQDNREGLLAGTDADGSPAAALSPETWKRGRGGSGPPRVPRESASRMITDYEVDVQEAADRTLLIGSWPNTPWVHFHGPAGRGPNRNNMPARDPIGIRPAGQALIAEALDGFIATLIGGGQ